MNDLFFTEILMFALPHVPLNTFFLFLFLFAEGAPKAEEVGKGDLEIYQRFSSKKHFRKKPNEVSTLRIDK